MNVILLKDFDCGKLAFSRLFCTSRYGLCMRNVWPLFQFSFLRCHLKWNRLNNLNAQQLFSICTNEIQTECELDYMNNEKYSIDKWVVISSTVNYYRRNGLNESYAELNKNKTKWNENKIFKKHSHVREIVQQREKIRIRAYNSRKSNGAIAVCQSRAHVTQQHTYTP